jgi:hypothetical protein
MILCLISSSTQLLAVTHLRHRVLPAQMRPTKLNTFIPTSILL